MSIIEPEDIAKWQDKQNEGKLFQVEQVEIIDVENGEEKPSEYWWAVSLIKDQSQYCFEVRNKDVAENLCDFLNDECYVDVDSAVDSYVIDNCIEWGNLITELSYKEVKLWECKEKYELQSEKIIEETDFKELYGKNNEKLRKEHVKNILYKQHVEIKKLEFSIDYIKRRISYLKKLVPVKTALLEVRKL